MGRKGPCFHCGVKVTPLWRHGPPEKPVLCNACGSRWRIKGTLENYIPRIVLNSAVNGDPHSSNQCHQPQRGSATNILITVHDAASSNSSQGLTHSSTWHSQIPSRKRSLAKHHSLSPIERLHRELYCMLQYQESSNWPTCSENVLIYENNTASCSEIGHGSILLRSSNDTVKEKFEMNSVIKEGNISSFNNTHTGTSSLTNSSLKNISITESRHCPNTKLLGKEGSECSSSSSHPLGSELRKQKIERIFGSENIRTLGGKDETSRALERIRELPAADIFQMGTSCPSLDMLSMEDDGVEPQKELYIKHENPSI